MAEKTQVVAFEGGNLRALEENESAREVVLALPLNRFVAKMVRVAPDANAEEVAAPLLQAMNPYPDDPLTVSCETVHSDERGRIVLAVTLPESAVEDVGEALDARKLNVTRVDVLELGLLRGLWSAIGEQPMRRLLLLKGAECLTLIVMDGDLPVALRAIADVSDLRRDVTLALLETEDFGGLGALGEIVVVGDIDTEPLSTFAPVRRVEVGENAALVGVAERTNAEGALNALPASWSDVLKETRFKARLTRNLAIAGGIWLLIVSVLFGVPVAYGVLTDRQQDQSRQHARKYRAVKEMKEKIDIIGKYSDHAHGLLEIMKAVSDRLPDGLTLTSWNFDRAEGLRIAGEADQSSQVYEFKDVLSALTYGEGEDAERVFKSVRMGALSASRNKQRFSLELGFKEEETE